MKYRYKKRINSDTLFERMDMSRGEIPDLLRRYWIYLWIIPWSLLLLLALNNFLTDYLWYFWRLVSLTLIVARYKDIFHYHGTTFTGYPASNAVFQRYVFLALIPTILGEIITYLKS